MTATSLIPEEPLDQLVFGPHNGTWTLHVEDAAAGDEGTLNPWGLDFTMCVCD